MIGFVSLELLISVRIVCWHLKQVSLTWEHSVIYQVDLRQNSAWSLVSLSSITH